jgi:Tfp pilus assembly protein PilN
VSHVNLLPPELRQRQATRRTTSLVALVGVAVLALIGFYYFLQTGSLSTAKNDLANQEATNAQVQSEVAKLQKYGALEATLRSKEQLVGSVLKNEVSWSSVLLDLSRIIPDDEALSQFSGQIGTTTTTATGGTTGLVGSMTFTGSVKEIDTLSMWLTRLETVKGWVNSWASTATESVAFSRIYTFSGGADLTTNALTRRGRGGQ